MRAFKALLAPFLSASPAAAAVRLTPTFFFCGVGTWGSVEIGAMSQHVPTQAINTALHEVLHAA